MQGQQTVSAQKPNRPAPLPAQAQLGQNQQGQAGQSNASGRQISSQAKVHISSTTFKYFCAKL